MATDKKKSYSQHHIDNLKKYIIKTFYRNPRDYKIQVKIIFLTTIENLKVIKDIFEYIKNQTLRMKNYYKSNKQVVEQGEK